MNQPKKKNHRIAGFIAGSLAITGLGLISTHTSESVANIAESNQKYEEIKKVDALEDAMGWSLIITANIVVAKTVISDRRRESKLISYYPSEVDITSDLE